MDLDFELGATADAQLHVCETGEPSKAGLSGTGTGKRIGATHGRTPDDHVQGL